MKIHLLQIPAKKALRRIFCMACHQDAGKYIVDGTIRICKSLALKITPEKFDKCGVLKAEERGAPWFGDDMVTPSADFGVGLAGAIKMLESSGGGDPQDEKLTKAAGEKPSGEQGPRNGAFPPFIPEDYKIVRAQKGCDVMHAQSTLGSVTIMPTFIVKFLLLKSAYRA